MNIGLRDPVVLALDERIGQLAPAEQLFMITRVLALAAAGLHSVAALSTAEVDRILATIALGDDELSQSLRKAQPRRSRKALEAGLAAMAGAPPLPGKTLRGRILRAANRIACIACDDISAAARALEQICREEGIDAPGAKREVDALLAYWPIPPADALRSRLGIS